MKFLPGDEIEYKVFYLEMNKMPQFETLCRSPSKTLLIRAENPPVSYFLDLYRRVGSSYEWTDKLMCPLSDLRQFLLSSGIEMYTFLISGWVGGFFVLDKRNIGVCDLAYFGLVDEAIGFGYGKYLLNEALIKSWEGKIKKVTVNTNTLDHRNALQLYKKFGFKILKAVPERRRLTRSRTIL